MFFLVWGWQPYTVYHFVFERRTEDVHGDYSNGLGKKMEETSSKETYQHL